MLSGAQAEARSLMRLLDLTNRVRPSLSYLQISGTPKRFRPHQLINSSSLLVKDRHQKRGP
jgi:hypothetical protein